MRRASRAITRTSGYCAAALLWMMAATASADDIFPAPLTSKNPERPLTVVQDHTFVGAQLKQGLDFDEFTVEDGKGPATLVIDSAATRSSDEPGETSLALSIECSPLCKLPLSKSVMLVRSEFMGENALPINGKAIHVWIARGIFAYPFGVRTQVWGSVVPDKLSHLDTKAIRVRWIYGTPDEGILPGQETRTGLFLKIGGSLLVLMILLGWWLRR